MLLIYFWKNFKMIRRSFVKQYLADFGLLFVGIFWGLGFVFVKIGLNTGVDPFYL